MYKISKHFWWKRFSIFGLKKTSYTGWLCSWYVMVAILINYWLVIISLKNSYIFNYFISVRILNISSANWRRWTHVIHFLRIMVESADMEVFIQIAMTVFSSSADRMNFKLYFFRHPKFSSMDSLGFEENQQKTWMAWIFGGDLRVANLCNVFLCTSMQGWVQEVFNIVVKPIYWIFNASAVVSGQ